MWQQGPDSALKLRLRDYSGVSISRCDNSTFGMYEKPCPLYHGNGRSDQDCVRWITQGVVSIISPVDQLAGSLIVKLAQVRLKIGR